MMFGFGPDGFSSVAQITHTHSDQTLGQLLATIGLVVGVIAVAYVVLSLLNRASQARAKRRAAEDPPRMFHGSPDAVLAFGMIVGIGFVPTEDQAETVFRELGLRSDVAFSLERFGELSGGGHGDWDDQRASRRYEALVRQRGWVVPRAGLSIEHRNVDGQRFITIEPRMPAAR